MILGYSAGWLLAMMNVAPLLRPERPDYIQACPGHIMRKGDPLFLSKPLEVPPYQGGDISSAKETIQELKHFQGDLDFQFSFAFQPIVNARTREIISFEALVRGPLGEPSDDVLKHVYDENVFQFDQTCHRKAIHLAGKLKIRHGLHLNLFPHALYQTGMNIRATLQASLKYRLA